MDATRSSLLQRVRDPAHAGAWREFHDLYVPLLTAYARRRGLDPAEAEDLAADVLGKLRAALPAFRYDRTRGRFRSYLWRLTYNAIVTRWRRRRSRNRAEARAARPEADGPEADGPEAIESEEAFWMEMHRRRVLTFTMEQVRGRSHPRTWSCFEQHVLQGRPAAEVAAGLGLSKNAVYINSSRVLGRVRNFCKEYLEGLADGLETLPD